MMSRYKGLSWSLLSHGQIHTNQYWSERGLSGISEPLGFYMTLWLYLSHCVCLKWMWGICRWQRQCKCRCISFLSMCLSPCVLAGHGCWVLINNFLQYSDGFRCHISHLPSKVWLEKNKNDRFTWPTNLEWSDHRRSICGAIQLQDTPHWVPMWPFYIRFFFFFRKPKVLCVAASDDQDTYNGRSCAELLKFWNSSVINMKNTRGLFGHHVYVSLLSEQFWNCCRSSLPSSRTLVLKV